MRARLILYIWLLGMLFPVAWPRNFSAAYRSIFDSIFGPERMHIAAHLFLFACLSFLLCQVLRPTSFLAAGRIILLILGIGILQETFQAISQHIPVFTQKVFPLIVFDLGIDLSGGAIGLLIYYIKYQLKKEFHSWFL